jgi:hypothetical protein
MNFAISNLVISIVGFPVIMGSGHARVVGRVGLIKLMPLSSSPESISHTEEPCNPVFDHAVNKIGHLCSLVRTHRRIIAELRCGK